MLAVARRQARELNKLASLTCAANVI